MKKKLTIILVILMILGCCLVGRQIAAFSLTPRIMGAPAVNAEEPWFQEEDYVFLMSVSLHHDTWLSVTFDTVEIYDTVTGQLLPPDCFLYDEAAAREVNHMLMGVFYGPMDTITEPLGEENMLPVSGTRTSSQEMVLGILWQAFPPWDHPVDIQVSYRVLGLVPKTEHLVYHWDTQAQEWETAP